jgi:tRNA1Val (adenine37-N6)-methyltransferase
VPAQGQIGVSMPNPYFQFKQFTIYHDRCAMKVTTDTCLFGSWCAEDINANTNSDNEINLFEIGTGSGLLSLMVAQKTNCIIDAIEIDEEAAQQAEENISDSPWKERIKVYREDVLLFNFSRQYDIIFSNPPFYENELSSGNKKKDTAHHGEGLKLEPLVQLIKQYLNPSGCFFLLLPFKRIAEAENILEKEHLFINKKLIVHQSLAHQPFRVMVRGGHNQLVKKEQHMFITGDNGEYTKEFVALLQEYYLYL